MNLQQIKQRKYELNQSITENRKLYEENLKSINKQIEEINKQEFMILNNLNTEKILLAEHFLHVEGFKGIGDDNRIIDEAIKELVENKGNNFFTCFIGTKDYAHWRHQGFNWLEYGYCPAHGYMVFTIEFKASVRGEHRRELTDEEIDAGIYYLQLIKAKRYPEGDK